ncbi:MAG: glucose-6-phosphate isomerase [Fimbriimonas sp.]
MENVNSAIDPQSLVLNDYQASVDARIQALEAHDFAARFWRKDPTLWGGDAERQKSVGAFVGWIDAATYFESKVEEIEAFVAEVRAAGFERVILAGMGGSSLAPYVFSLTSPKVEGGLPVEVLDSTDPGTVLRIERGGDLAKTLVIVSSKSGSTAEPTAFDAFLFDRVGKPENFVAITDPGSPFHKAAESRGFRKIFLNLPDVGGRYSALTFFGLVPAALMGHDVRAMLRRATDLISANTKASDPAFALGAALGELALQGRDKLTFFTPPNLASLGLWMEQLVAESTGKEGKGILPIALEQPGAPTVYGHDRVFVVFRDGNDEPRVAALRDAGHPIVTIDLQGPYAVAQEMMRFEIATAVAGAVLDINPFDQPNVQESKDVTKAILAKVEAEGKLPDSPLGLDEEGLQLFGDTCADTIAEAITVFLDDRKPGDYIALHAYLDESDALNEALGDLQREVRDATGLATTLGYGPRFLHSTGQYHKGGPNNGFFIQLTGDHPDDAPIPGQRATWAQFVDAQAMGDIEALKAKGRRTLRIHVSGDLVAGVQRLTQKIASALAR